MKRKQFYACLLALGLATGPVGANTAYAQTLTQPSVAAQATTVEQIVVDGLSAPVEGELLDFTAVITANNGALRWNMDVIWVDEAGHINTTWSNANKSYPVFNLLPAGYKVKDGFDVNANVQLSNTIKDIYGDRELEQVVDLKTGRIFCTCENGPCKDMSVEKAASMFSGEMQKKGEAENARRFQELAKNSDNHEETPLILTPSNSAKYITDISEEEQSDTKETTNEELKDDSTSKDTKDESSVAEDEKSKDDTKTDLSGDSDETNENDDKKDDDKNVGEDKKQDEENKTDEDNKQDDNKQVDDGQQGDNNKESLDEQKLSEDKEKLVSSALSVTVKNRSSEGELINAIQANIDNISNELNYKDWHVYSIENYDVEFEGANQAIKVHLSTTEGKENDYCVDSVNIKVEEADTSLFGVDNCDYISILKKGDERTANVDVGQKILMRAYAGEGVWDICKYKQPRTGDYWKEIIAVEDNPSNENEKIITALAPGLVTLTLTNGNETYCSLDVNVYDPDAPMTMDYNNFDYTIDLEEGKNYTLDIEQYDTILTRSTVGELTFEMSKDGIVGSERLDENELVLWGDAVGHFIVTAKTKDGEYCSFDINVREMPLMTDADCDYSMTISDRGSRSFSAKEYSTIYVKVDDDINGLEWSTTNSDVVEFKKLTNRCYIIIAKTAGSADITAKSNGEEYCSINLYVEP